MNPLSKRCFGGLERQLSTKGPLRRQGQGGTAPKPVKRASVNRAKLSPAYNELILLSFLNRAAEKATRNERFQPRKRRLCAARTSTIHINALADDLLSPAEAQTEAPWLQRGHVTIPLGYDALVGGMAPEHLFEVREGDPRWTCRPECGWIVISLGKCTTSWIRTTCAAPMSHGGRSFALDAPSMTARKRWRNCASLIFRQTTDFASKNRKMPKNSERLGNLRQSAVFEGQSMRRGTQRLAPSTGHLH